MEKKINNRIDMYQGLFTVLIFDGESKIVTIEDEPAIKPKRYNTAQVRPYVEDPEEVAVRFVSYSNKAIANFRDVDEGFAPFLSATDSSESISDTSKSSK